MGRDVTRGHRPPDGGSQPLERSYQPVGSAPFFQDLCNWRRIPEFRDFVENSPLGRIAGELLGAHEVRFFHDHVLVKEPGTSLVTPWHQDGPYYCARGPQTVSFWIPLDPVPAANALECVAGSINGGVTTGPCALMARRSMRSMTARPCPISIRAEEYSILSWDMEPGDAVAFDFGTVHGAAATVEAIHRRRVFSARWWGMTPFSSPAGGRDRRLSRISPFRMAIRWQAPIFPFFTRNRREGGLPACNGAFRNGSASGGPCGMP